MKRILYFILIVFSFLLLSCEKGEVEKTPSLFGTWQVTKVVITTYHNSSKTEDKETLSPEDYYIEFKEDGKALFFHSDSTKETTYEFNEAAHKLHIKDSFSISASGKSVSLGSMTYSDFTLSYKQLIIPSESRYSLFGSDPVSWEITLERK